MPTNRLCRVYTFLRLVWKLCVVGRPTLPKLFMEQPSYYNTITSFLNKVLPTQCAYPNGLWQYMESFVEANVAFVAWECSGVINRLFFLLRILYPWKGNLRSIDFYYENKYWGYPRFFHSFNLLKRNSVWRWPYICEIKYYRFGSYQWRHQRYNKKIHQNMLNASFHNFQLFQLIFILPLVRLLLCISPQYNVDVIDAPCGLKPVEKYCIFMRKLSRALKRSGFTIVDRILVRWTIM